VKLGMRLSRIVLSALVVLWGLVAAPAWADAPAPVAPAPVAPHHTVKAADVAVYAPKGGKLEARVLIDADTVGPTQASLTLLTLRNETQIPLHRQTSAKIIYVLDGYARVSGLGKALGKGVDVGPGDAVYVPAGVAAGLLSKCCKLAPSRFLILYAPGGPERPYKDPASAKTGGWTTAVPPDERARPAADAPQPKIVKGADVKDLPIAGGKAHIKILIEAGDGERAGDGAAYAGLLTAGAGTSVPEHVHGKEDELLWILSGKGSMTVAGETLPVEAGMAVHIPAGAKHSFQTDAGLTAVQFYTPSGPEQRFKVGAEKAAGQR
jgi:mannose-6-phosphate isomerase-like protein (cupin superfamily)